MIQERQKDFKYIYSDKNQQNIDWLYNRLEEKQIDKQLIYIVDPFNKSYNPAKTVFKNNDIFKIWQDAYNNLQEDKCDYEQIKLYNINNK